VAPRRVPRAANHPRHASPQRTGLGRHAGTLEEERVDAIRFYYYCCYYFFNIFVVVDIDIIVAYCSGSCCYCCNYYNYYYY
jgi:hypothetical protein